MTEKTFKISGIHCAACSSILEKFMSRQEGVQSVSVNLTTEKWTSSMTIGSTPTKYASSSRALVSVLRSISLPMRSRRSVAKGRSRRSSRSSTALKSASYCALFFALPLLYVSMGHMAGLPLPSFMSPHHAPLTFALVQLALTLPIVIGGRGFYINGFGSLVKDGHTRCRRYVFGAPVRHLRRDQDRARRHELCGKPVFRKRGGRNNARHARKIPRGAQKRHTSDAIRALTELAPETALVTRHGETGEVPVSELRVGDVISVRHGERFPCDGVVTSRASSADLSMLTGESLPVTLDIGGTVTGGSINGEGLIVFTATRVGGDTALAQIIRMVEDAQGKKAPIAS